MPKLTENHLFQLSIISILLIKTTGTDFLHYSCDTDGNYTTNSTYRKNLDITLSTLPATTNGFGFFNSSTGRGTDRVNSAALCRGDLEPALCRSCLNDSVVRLREVCPNQKGAVGYYDECWLRYSNKTILGNTGEDDGVFLRNTQNASDPDGFSRATRLLLNELRDDAAAGGSLRKFASGNTTGPATINGLVQCTPDLSGPKCSDCLDKAIRGFFVQFGGHIGGRILQTACNFRYEVYRFFNGSTLVVSPPPISAATPPVSSATEGTIMVLQIYHVFF
ncbi:hypothetical protein SSX86_020005 [Deinandra increscens subsp. villosa]|uniref:Gnk2-homologous domain-containing protein n=1 Tax=Deinandra increscens subsp. villosa TaxID=3103831 RepID=A0AAP0CTP7_9ASTR